VRKTAAIASVRCGAGVCFGPEYSSDDAGDGPEYVEWGDQLVTVRQMKLILANSEKWEFYLQLKVTSEDWWADPEKIYKAMERGMSAEYFMIFREDVEKGRIGHLIGFHDFLRGFESSPLGVEGVQADKLTRRQERRAHGADWDLFSRCSGGSWVIGAWELLAKIKLMERNWGEEVMDEVVEIVSKEFKRDERDEDLDFEDFLRLLTCLWRRRRARQEMKRAFTLLKVARGESRVVLIIDGEDSGSLEREHIACRLECELAEDLSTAAISWSQQTMAKRPRQVAKKKRRIGRRERCVAFQVIKYSAGEKRERKRITKSVRSTSGQGIVKKIWKVKGMRRKRMRGARMRAVKMTEPWKPKEARKALTGTLARVVIGFRIRELHGLRPQEAWLAWTSARDGIG
jgi:hypothetical protein